MHQACIIRKKIFLRVLHKTPMMVLRHANNKQQWYVLLQAAITASRHIKTYLARSVEKIYIEIAKHNSISNYFVSQ